MKHSQKYIISFLITALFFAIAFLWSAKLSQEKLDTVSEIQSRIATDILSSETRFALLRSTSCVHVIEDDEFENSLTAELNEFARRVKFMESQVGQDDVRVLNLKEQYSLLQIKDYLLIKELASRCGKETTTILSFHDLDCEDCNEQSIVLDELHARRPDVRIYWLDRSINSPAIDTLLSIYKIKEVPSLVIDEKTYSGFQDLETLEDLLPPAPEPKEEASVTEEVQ